MFILLNSLVFLGAFLLFTIELIVANALLPGFGGSYLVWSSCMLFFQGMLFIGYTYAYLYQWKLNLRQFFPFHLLLLLIPIAFFPIHLDMFQNPSYARPMIIEILGLLLKSIGLAFCLLTSTSIILQQYLGASKLTLNKNPYVLYATSNLGSIAALYAYPLIVQPFLTLHLQMDWWQKGYAIFVLLHIILLVFIKRLIPHHHEQQTLRTEPLSAGRITKWLLLSASASALLLAVTNTITFDLAAIPLFWIVPLSIYLLSFILTFKRNIWYPRWLKDRFPMAVIIGVFLYLLMLQSYRLPVQILFVLHPAILLIVCVTCNGELIRSRPASVSQITIFYLVMSFGSFLGSLLVSWLIPLISTSIIEYPIALILAVIAQGFSTKKEHNYKSALFLLVAFVIILIAWPLIIAIIHPQTGSFFAVLFGLMIALVLYTLRNMKMAFTTGLIFVLVFSFFVDKIKIGQHLLHKHRNFYGIYKIVEKDGKRFLQHGTTLHGSQYIDPNRQAKALTYYHIKAPAGELLSTFSADIENVALVGLGAGSLVTYTQKNQTIDVFELDPYNKIVAEKYFTFLAHCQGKLRLFFGDARVKLRDIRDKKYDVLIIDAFNSDAIPVHLLTMNAISEYLNHLNPDGIILFHISNKYLDLSPVLLANGQAMNLSVLKKRYLNIGNPDAESCEWAALTQSADWANKLTQTLHWIDLKKIPVHQVRPWTDHYTNILSVIR